MNSLTSPLLYVVNRHGGSTFYALSYYVSGAVDAALQIVVTVEFARQSLHKQNRWLPGVRTSLAAAAVVALAVSAFLSVNSQPSAENSADVFFLRISLFVTMFILILSITTLLLSFQNGQLWGKPVVHLFGGFLVWSVFSGVTDTLHLLKSNSSVFEMLENSRAGITVLVTAFWVLAVLLPPKGRSSLQSDSYSQEFALRLQVNER